MEEFALIKSHVNSNRVNLGIALISDHKVCFPCSYGGDFHLRISTTQAFNHDRWHHKR